MSSESKNDDSRSLRIIDSHQHVFWHGQDDKGLVDDMDQGSIDQAWLLTWDIAPFEYMPIVDGVLNPVHRRPDGTHAGIPLSDLIIAKARFPSRFILGYCPHPLLGDAPELLRAATLIHGVRICGEWKFRLPIDDPRSINLFRVAGELGLPVVLHLDVPYLLSDTGKSVYQPDWYGGTIDNLERALLLCPETNFIGHAPGFWREISGDAHLEKGRYPTGEVVPNGRLAQLFEKYANLYADLSAGSGVGALKRDPGYARTLLETFSDRILFGRDYYGNILDEFLRSLDLSPETKFRIYSGNAESLVPSNI